MNFRTSLLPAIAAAFFFLTACTKIDYTRLGGDLIPVVDNINTFDTILQVVANNYLDDSEYRLNTSNPHVVGALSQDPIFGTSKATMFFEFKPPSYPYIFAPYDSLKGSPDVGFDSAVMVLTYLGYYGDSSEPVNLKLYEINDRIEADTSLTPYYTMSPNLTANTAKLWGTATVRANRFGDTIPIKRGDDTIQMVTKQLRVRLNDTYARQLFLSDTTTVFQNDNLFQQYLPGFALEADPSSKTLLYFSLGTSKIEFYYRANPSSTAKDTTSSQFSFTGTSGHAVKFENNRAGAEINDYLAKDPVDGRTNIYVQASPGTSATLEIDGLKQFKLKNRVIHRAELRITQISPLPDPQLIPPQALYLDVIDTLSDLVYKGVPYDLFPTANYYCFPNANLGINFNYFGGLTNYDSINGDSRAVYRFNLSRYVQGLVTRNEPSYDFRLSAPFYVFYRNCANGGLTYPSQVFAFSQNGALLIPPGFGRIKLAGGNHPDLNLRMQMRIIYSNL